MTSNIKPGDIVQFDHYGATRTGRVVRALGASQVLILRTDGPMVGTQTWVHRASIAVAKGFDPK
jgi:hypothetical protein